MKLTKVQKTTRFIVHSIIYMFILGNLTGIIPAIMLGQVYQILGL